MNKQSDKLFSLGFDRNQAPLGPRELEGTFDVPDWLNGSFIRNGPGLFYIGHQRFNHWFDGLGMLHKFDFDKGRVYYHSEFLECTASHQAMENDKLTYAEFATDPCWNIFGRMRSIFKHGPTDSAKVSLAKVRDQYYALGETTMQLEFDVSTLKTIGDYNYGQPKFGSSSTAHLHFSGDEAYNMITRYGPVNRYMIKKMDEKAESAASVNTLSPSYMHSFGMSEKYFIIAESPYTVQSINLMVANRPFINNFHWQKNRGTRIWIIDKNSGKTILKKEIEPFFFFHFVNAFDDGEKVTFDIVTYQDSSIISAYYLDNISKPESNIPGGTLKRFEVSLDTGDCTSRVLSEARIELPHIYYDKYNCNRNYKYVYAMGLTDSSSSFYDQIVKIDIPEQHDIYWKEKGCYPGEPFFIPYPESQKEDEGIVLSIVLDTLQERSFLLLLDAKSFEEITRIYTPEPIMVGFHGNYFKRESA